MPRRKRFRWKGGQHGLLTVEVDSWKYYPNLVREYFLDWPEYIYRGQGKAEWPLESSLDRILRAKGLSAVRNVRRRHLENFQRATVGRRGPNPQRIALEDENDWWALGQHQGLTTPLLDWSRSPYVAAYFAFEKREDPPSEQCAIYVLDTDLVRQKVQQLKDPATEGEAPEIVEFVRPLQDDNARLISQGGVFTRAPDRGTVDAWVTSNFEEDYRSWVVLRVMIPYRDREVALRELNRMNINRVTLFPDIAGASAYCNMALDINQY